MLAAFGVDPFDEQVYRVVLRHSGGQQAMMADALGTSVAALHASVRRLSELGLVRTTTDSVVAEPPDIALGHLIETEAHRLREAQQSLASARTAIPEFRAEQRRGAEPQRVAGGFEVVLAEDMAETLVMLLTHTTGEMLFLRPDQWATPGAALVDPHVIAELTRGRTSRALYPEHALAEAGDPIWTRRRAGERVRVLPSLPSRLWVLGDSAAMIPGMWVQHHGERLLIQHPGVVRALRCLFDELWRRATALPGLDDEPNEDRRQLLELLASGAIDEQVARTLGVSLRTVRRRIAGLMDDLGVTSRYQLGAEAVRRGWL